MKMSVWGCVLAVMVVEAAAVGVVEKVSVVLGGHTELDCGEGADSKVPCWRLACGAASKQARLTGKLMHKTAMNRPS